MLDQLINLDIAKEIVTVLMAMLPIAELRLSLPIAINVFHMPWYEAFILSFIGNMLPIPFILLFFDGVSRLLQRTKEGKRFIDWLLKRTASKTESIEKYKHMGLIIFIAIPLPLTGAWTGALASYIMGMKFWPALRDVALGVLGAGVIVTGLSLLGWWGAIIAGIGIIILLAVSFLKPKNVSKVKTDQD